MGQISRLTTALSLCAVMLTAGPAGFAANESAASAGVASILRVNLITADIDRLKHFYQDAFNFKVEMESVVGQGALAETIARQWSLPAGAKLYTVILRAPDGNTALGLTSVVGGKLQVLSRAAKQPPRGGDHYMILKVRNIEAVEAKLKSMGVAFWRPMMQVTGGQEFGVYDPDGTRLIVEEGAA
jgi:predicted enzyme related to lactoylglutathione lyase